MEVRLLSAALITGRVKTTCRGLLAALLLVAGLSAPMVSGAPASAVLPRLHAEPDVTNGGRIIDSGGREVLLRGVNVNALGQYWQGTDIPPTLPFDKRDPARISAIGWNVVRLIVSWSRVEPKPGQYNEAYLDRVGRWIDRLEKNGVYTIIDFHQDAWGATLAARPGETCIPPQQPGFGWDGAPGWATQDDGAPRCFNNAREVNPAVINSWQNFFADSPAADGVGIRTHYVRSLRRVAKRFAKSSAVAGIDIMNEPGTLGPAGNAALGPFYAAAVRAIRAGEKSGRGFSHLILFEPSVLWSLLGSGAPPPFSNDRNLVYAPHLYGGSIGGEGPPSRPSFETALAEAKTFGGAPVLTGEWGGDPKRATGADDDYFNAHQALQDEFRIGATVWTWKQSCGDPHAATHDPGTAPPLPPWSLYRMDCENGRNRIVGQFANLSRDLRRAYVRRAPGRLLSASYTPSSKTLEVTGTRSRKVSGQVEIFYPSGSAGVKTDKPLPRNAISLRRIGHGKRQGVVILIPVKPGDWSIKVDPGLFK